MANNQNVNKVIYDGTILMDVTDTTATESDVLSGKAFTLASGAKATGSLVTTEYEAGDGIEINENVISSHLNMDLLWTNSSPTSDFTEQTLNLDLSQYSLIYIVVKFSTSSSSNVIGFLADTNFNGIIVASHFRNYVRSANISSNSIVFGNCGYFATYGTNTRTTSNGNLIPIRIYGIK